MEFMLFGAGGHALSVADALRRAGHRVVAVVAPEGTVRVEADAITSEEDGIRWARDRGWQVLVAIGDNRRRLSLAERLIGDGFALPSFVATTATVAHDAQLDAGTIVLEHAHVGPGARLGTATVVNTGAVVEHEVRLGAGCHVAPHATLSGGVQVGSGVLVGAGATVLPGVSVGEWSVVGFRLGGRPPGAGSLGRDRRPSQAAAAGIDRRPWPSQR